MLFFMNLLLVLIVFILLISVTCFLFSWVDAWFTIPHYIQFHEFQKLYEVNPGKWKLYTNYISHGGYWDDKYKFKFNLKDYCKYFIWKREVEKQQKINSKNNEYRAFLNEIKSDIDKINKRNY